MPKKIDLTGNVYGELTVIEMLWNYKNKHKTYCRCIGIDQKEYIVRQDALQSGATTSIRGACTTGKPQDITGQKFGRLTAIQPTKMRATNGGVRWECICDCGQYVYPTMNNLKRGHTTSCGCAKNDYIESCKLNIVGKRYGMLVVLEEYLSDKNKRRMVKCQCDCGNIHICSVMDLTTGHTASCGCNKKSRGEKFIEEYMDSLNVQYLSQYRFPDCKNKKKLPFDFFLPQYNVCIEYDGRQHFFPVRFWGGEEMFKVRQINDNIKTEYCKSHGITLIRIPYTMKKNEIIKLINNIVSPATITA